LLDVQESPYADLAIIQLVVAVLRELVTEAQASYAEQKKWSETALAGILQTVLQEGRHAQLTNRRYLNLFGVAAESMVVGELWQHLAHRLVPAAHPFWPALRVILEEGPLARRISTALAQDSGRDRLAAVYRQLCQCLQEGQLFHA
ncbi:MAG: glutamate--cysteine ligase, partial [Desulfuromonadales bacterium]